MSFEEEKEFLKQFKQKAEQRQMLDIHEIKEAYIAKVGHMIGRGQTYRVLH